jgi:hypothetical protein
MSQQPKRFEKWTVRADPHTHCTPNDLNNIIDWYNAAVDEIARKDAIITMHEWIGEHVYQRIPEAMDIETMAQFLLTLYPPVVCRVGLAKDLMQGLAEKSKENTKLHVDNERLTTENERLSMDCDVEMDVRASLAKDNKRLTTENAQWDEINKGVTAENARFRDAINVGFETLKKLKADNERLEGIIKNIQERNSEMKYQIAFKDWKLGELHCPTCESIDLSPPNQYCTKQYVCKKCSLQFDPVKEHENVELPGLENKDAETPAATKPDEDGPSYTALDYQHGKRGDPCEGCKYKDGNRCIEPSIMDLYRFDKRNFVKLPCDNYTTAGDEPLDLTGEDIADYLLDDDSDVWNAEIPPRENTDDDIGLVREYPVDVEIVDEPKPYRNVQQDDEDAEYELLTDDGGDDA